MPKTYSWSNDLTDTKYSPSARTHCRERFERFFFSERVVAAATWAAMKAKTKIGNEEDDDEKADTSNIETKRCVSVNVGRARVLDRWNGQHGESGK